MECMEWDASLVASYRPRETWRQAQQRLSATVQQPGWEIGGLRIAIEAFSGLFCANRHQSPVCTVQEVRVGRDSVAILPVESLPLRSARVIRSGVEPRSRLGEMDPSTPGVVPVPVARQARSSRRQTQPPRSAVTTHTSLWILETALVWCCWISHLHNFPPASLLSCRAAQKPAAAGKRPGKPFQVGESATHLPALSQ